MTSEEKPCLSIDARTIARFWSKVDRSGDCWLWKGSLTPKGYGHFFAFGKMTKAHRVSWLIYGETIQPGAFVCHRCNNPTCVNPNHLFAGSHDENMADMYSKGRGRSKVSYAIATEIRECVRLSPRGSRRAIAARFGVSVSLVKKILENKMHTRPSEIHA